MPPRGEYIKLVFLLFLLLQKVLVHGNATENEATSLAESVRRDLRCAPLPTTCATVRRGIILNPGTEYVYAANALDFNPNEQNSAIEMLLFTSRSPGAGDHASKGMVIKLMNLKPFYHTNCR